MQVIKKEKAYELCTYAASEKLNPSFSMLKGKYFNDLLRLDFPMEYQPLVVSYKVSNP